MLAKVLVGGILVALLVGLGMAMPAIVIDATPASLAGVVSSREEGRMEGVLVTAKREGSTIATTVVSDATGTYRFPVDRLVPGTYAIRIRATGYDLQGPATVEIGEGGTLVGLVHGLADETEFDDIADLVVRNDIGDALAPFIAN